MSSSKGSPPKAPAAPSPQFLALDSSSPTSSKRSSFHGEMVAKAKLRKALQGLEDRKTVKKAAAHVEDGLEGRDKHGKAFAQKNGAGVQWTFWLQTHPMFLRVVISCMMINMSLSFVDSNRISNSNNASFLPWWYFIVEALCLVIITIDMLCKAYYMNFKDYFKKSWQRTHGVVIVCLWLDMIIQMYDSTVVSPLFIVRALRPALIITRSREVRRVYTGDVFLALFYVLAAYAVVGCILFRDVSDFSSLPQSLLALFILSTTDNYPDIMEKPLKQTPLAALFFVSFLCVGVFFLMPLIMGVIVNSYLLQSKAQVLKDLRKQRAGLSKAFKALDEGDGITMGKWNQLMEALKVSSDRILTRWFFELLDKDFNGSIDALEFMHVGELLAFEFKLDDARPLFTLSDARRTTLEKIRDSSFRYWFVQLSAVCLVVFAAVAVPIQHQLVLTTLLVPSEYVVVAVYVCVLVLLLDLLLLTLLSAYVDWEWRSPLSMDVGFTFVACVSSIVLVFSLDEEAHDYIHFAQVLRCAVCFVFVHSARIAEPIRRIFASASKLVPVLVYMCGFLLCIGYFYALVGIHFFSNDVEAWSQFHSALLTVFTLLIGGWSEHLDVVMQTHAVSGVVFFVSFYVLTVMLVFNLVTALVISYFEVVADIKGEMRVELPEAQINLRLVPSRRFSTIGWRKDMVANELLNLTSKEIKALNTLTTERRDVETLKRLNEAIARHVMSETSRKEAAQRGLRFMVRLTELLGAESNTTVHQVVANSTVLQLLGSTALANLCERGKPRMVVSGSDAVQCGDKKNELFLLTHGEAHRISKDDSEAPKVVKHGLIFEEKTLLDSHRYEYTLRAVSDCRFVVFSFTDLIDAFMMKAG